ncbi:MAG: alkaline phosphatase family protein [Ignavibacteria bacterium]|nr:alkaline phosphatase family protein [Ignavibacteria bacterium]
MRVLMLFLDGVGIGKSDPSVNPFFAAKLPAIRSLFDGEVPSLRKRTLSSRHATLVPLDATLGVAGLPQSGTGQTALFTGVNASKLVGKHFGPHPYSTLKPIVKEKNIFKRLLDVEKKPCFANAFPQRFFDYMNNGRSRLTVTTLSCMMSGIPILRAEDLVEGRGISADITSEGWRTLGYPDMPTIEPAEAGRRLARLSAQHDFVLFEYWKPDRAGHSRNMNEAIDVLQRFDAMLIGILEALDSSDTLLLITSDHGNVEDLSSKSHTRNPVPAILYGHRHDEIAHRLNSASKRSANIAHVTPNLMEALAAEEQPARVGSA